MNKISTKLFTGWSGETPFGSCDISLKVREKGPIQKTFLWFSALLALCAGKSTVTGGFTKDFCCLPEQTLEHKVKLPVIWDAIKPRWRRCNGNEGGVTVEVLKQKSYMIYLYWHGVLSQYYMVTSSNGNIFRVTGPLCGEFTGHRWIPRTKASDAELWSFLWSAPE